MSARISRKEIHYVLFKKHKLWRKYLLWIITGMLVMFAPFGDAANLLI
ncbi:galactoside permease [Shigella sonnei]|nr:galactoside permease [Shigella sonnei]